MEFQFLKDSVKYFVIRKEDCKSSIGEYFVHEGIPELQLGQRIPMTIESPGTKVVFGDLKGTVQSVHLSLESAKKAAFELENPSSDPNSYNVARNILPFESGSTNSKYLSTFRMLPELGSSSTNTLLMDHFLKIASYITPYSHLSNIQKKNTQLAENDRKHGLINALEDAAKYLKTAGFVVKNRDIEIVRKPSSPAVAEPSTSLGQRKNVKFLQPPADCSLEPCDEIMESDCSDSERSVSLGPPKKRGRSTKFDYRSFSDVTEASIVSEPHKSMVEDDFHPTGDIAANCQFEPQVEIPGERKAPLKDNANPEVVNNDINADLNSIEET